MEPVQERSIATRRALLDAALSCLAERGYVATTTIETARRAGVSRGAQQHHFATKAELMAAAVEHLLARRLEEFRKAFTDLDPNVDVLDATLDLLWSMYEGPTFAAWAELWMAARTDPALAAAMVRVDREFEVQSIAVHAELLPPAPGGDPELRRLARDLAVALMDGVALARLVTYSEQRPARDYIDALKFIFKAFTPLPPIEDSP